MLSLAMMTSVAGAPRPAAPWIEVEGAWIVLSVIRSGEPDRAQEGALLTFTDDEVMFAPRVEQWVLEES